ncbi:MAG: c-type cytochrome [Gemmatimonadetes bacterium]|nr:c-type cytochrome [Gemmatimonadota bacterium]
MSARLAGTAALLVALAAAPAAGQQAPAGKAIYEKWCAGCHGSDGKGDGPAASTMLPRPRDFTRALFKVRTTSSGSVPTDADLRHVIDDGMPGSAMPGWTDVLSESDRDALVQYIKTFSTAFQQKPDVVAFSKAPPENAAAIEDGRRTYEKLECFKCHGRAARGDGPSASTQEDDSHFPIRPANLEENWRFRGGGSVEDIYRRLRTGLDGTPMPSFNDMLAAKVVTDEQLWHVAQYVRSLSPKEPPEPPEVIRARLVEGRLPTSPDDSAWNVAERAYIPLVGQVIIKPRWFSPAVDAVWVQALHNGRDLAIRLVWDDRSRSPDPRWSEWQRRVTEVMGPKEDSAAAPAAATSGTSGSDAAPPAPADRASPAGATPAVPALGDAFAVQFPREIPQGMERPYFLMGDARNPVYLWYWRSDAPAAVEATARGLANITPIPGPSTLRSQAVFDRGQWRLVLTRPLAAPGGGDRLTLVQGEAIPIAFFAWDGSNGESGTKGAVSAWYHVYLDEPTPKTVYTTPIATAALTAGFGILVVARAQRREKQGGSKGD